MSPPPREPTWPEVEAFVAAHPDGASFQQIAAVFGVSWQAIQIVVRGALEKLRAARAPQEE